MLGADRNHANHLLIALLDGQEVVGEVDHKVGDELVYGEGTTKLAQLSRLRLISLFPK